MGKLFVTFGNPKIRKKMVYRLKYQPYNLARSTDPKIFLIFNFIQFNE